MKRTWLMILTSILATTIIFGVVGCGKQDGTVVAKVGDRSIFIEDIEQYFNRPGLKFISAESELMAKRTVLDSLISQQLLIVGAFEHNLENQEEVLRVVEGEKIKFLLDVLFDEKILSKATPSEAEIKDWFIRMGEEIKASHIIVDSEATAHEVLGKLKEGANFEELAVEYSVDPSVKRNQGDLGWFTWGTMLDNFQKAAFSMQPGEVSSPVKTEYGYHVIKVIDRREVEHRPSYAESKDYIRNMIIERRKRTLMQDYQEKLREKYPITVEEPTCQFVLNKLEFLYPPMIGEQPRWRNNIDPNQLDMDEKALVLGRFDGGELVLGEYLSNLRRVPPENRPDFDKYDEMEEILFQMSFMNILEVEAKQLGLENSEKYRSRMSLFKERVMADVMRNDSIPYGVELDEGEVQEYYDTHPEEFTSPRKYHLLEVQVSDSLQAAQYVNSLKTETQFRKTASEHTMRPGKKQVGGDLGLIQQNQYPELFELAEGITRGRIGGPVKSGGKFSVIWILKKEEPVLENFNMVKRRIIEKMSKDKGDALFTEWIESMKKRVSVEIYDDVLVGSIDEAQYVQPDSTDENG